MAHYHSTDSGKLLELKYPDSIYDNRLFLLKDGRKRGLWVFLEEDPKERLDADRRWFDEGVKKMFEELGKKPRRTELTEWELRQMLRNHFDMFFGHRTEATAVRMSWRKSKKLAAAINKEIKREKHKSLEDYDDAYGDDPED